MSEFNHRIIFTHIDQFAKSVLYLAFYSMRV